MSIRCRKHLLVGYATSGAVTAKKFDNQSEKSANLMAIQTVCIQLLGLLADTGLIDATSNGR